MELREYWTIFRRRWWIPVGLTVLVGLFSLIQLRPWQARPPTYAASLRMLVGVLPAKEGDAATYYDPRYYAWLTSEYLVDDFTEVVRSQLFADNVSKRMAAQNIQIPAGVIQGSAATGKQHRIITLNLSWGDQAQLEAMIKAAAAELSENADRYFQQLGTPGAGIQLIDGPSIGPVGASVRDRIELPLRLLLAFLVGVGIEFLLYYLDTALRSSSDLEKIGLPVLGRIPKTKRRR